MHILTLHKDDTYLSIIFFFKDLESIPIVRDQLFYPSVFQFWYLEWGGCMDGLQSGLGNLRHHRTSVPSLPRSSATVGSPQQTGSAPFPTTSVRQGHRGWGCHVETAL